MTTAPTLRLDHETHPRRPRRPGWPRARSEAATIATAGLVLLAAACGGPPVGHVAQLGSTVTRTASSANPPAASAGARASGALAFSRCMRSHGVPNFPDPDSSGRLPKSQLQHLGVSVGSSQFQAAQAACRNLLPTESAAQRRQQAAQALKFSRCMRGHGATNFPDPASNGRIPDPASVGINQGAARFQAANRACRNDRPGYIPSNAAYNAWAKTHGS